MKGNRIAVILSCTFLVAATAWSAPKTAKPNAAKPVANKPATVYRIEITTDDGGHGGRFGGSGSSLILRSNGTANRTQSFASDEMETLTDADMEAVSGTFKQYQFQKLLDTIQRLKLFNLKVPPSGDGPYTSITLVRGSKSKSITIHDNASSAAVSAVQAIHTLAQGITADTDWKNKAGRSVNTGMQGRFIYEGPGLTEEQACEFSAPAFTVRDAKNKVAGTLRQTNPYGNFKLVLPPGTYRATFDLPAPDAKYPAPKGYVWRAVPETIQVQAGSLTEVKIALQTAPAAP